MTEKARGIDLRRHVGEHELNRLEFGDGLAERESLLRVVARCLIGATRDPDGECADRDAPAVEDLHRVDESVTDLA